MVPTLTPLPPLPLAAATLDVGDVLQVAPKGQAAARAISAWFAAVGRLPAELNAWSSAMSVALAEIEAHPGPVSVDCQGAARHSPFYVSRINSVAVAESDVRAGRELRLVNIAPFGSLPTSEEFYAERALGGLRWAGPLLASTGIITEEPNTAPVADAGADVTLEQGQTLRRVGAGTDSDGTITAYRWLEGERIVSVSRTLEIAAESVGTRAFSLTVTDDRGATSAPDVFVLSTEHAVLSDYDALVARPLRADRRITNNTAELARLHLYSRRPVFTASGDRLIVPRSRYGQAVPTVYDVLDTDGRVLHPDIRTEREAMAAFGDPYTAIGLRDTATRDQLARSDWRQATIEIIYDPGGRLLIGDMQGRQSLDDRYIVVRRLSGNTLVSIDMQRGLVLGSIPTPTDYQWSSVSPDGRYILVNKLPGGDGLTRYDLDFGGKRPLVREREEGDMVMGADGTPWYVQCGAVPKIINLDTGIVTNIDTGGRRSDGHVSGVARVPGMLVVSWTVDGVREIASMNLADGADMWQRRTTWKTLPGIERRGPAYLMATPSPNGRRIVYRASATPNSGVPDLHILER